MTRINGFNTSELPEYWVWSGIKSRCNNMNNHAYRYYGGRGIKVCDRWNNSFVAFYQDMGARPSSKHSIDRIDANDNYEPGNCRWATQNTQASNKRYGLPRSGFTGVYRRPSNKRSKSERVWVYEVILNGKRHRSRRYETPEKAAIARDFFLINNGIDAPLLLNKLLDNEAAGA